MLTLVGGGSLINAPIPVTLADYNDTEQTIEALAANAGEIAAVILEPMMGSGGCIPATPEFLVALRAAPARQACSWCSTR